MNRRHCFSLIALVGIVILSPSCSKKDRSVQVADDDPEMIVAITEARESLPGFWRVFEKPERGESGFALKVKITDRNGSEHFWVTDLHRQDGKLTGTVNNDPNIVKSVKLGDRIEISDSDITDWLYLRESKMVGNRTVRPLFRKMPAEQVERVKKMMADQ